MGTSAFVSLSKVLKVRYRNVMSELSGMRTAMPLTSTERLFLIVFRVAGKLEGSNVSRS
jgi:hypothetical protein